jgi:hypothetical protein
MDNQRDVRPLLILFVLAVAIVAFAALMYFVVGGPDTPIMPAPG